MGVLDHFSDMFDCGDSDSNHKKRKKLQTVEIKIKIDCEGCERKVRMSVERMKGVTLVDVSPKQNKLTVTGCNVVVCVAHQTGKKATSRTTLWRTYSSSLLSVD